MKENHIIVPYLNDTFMYDKIAEGAIGSCFRTMDGQVFKKYHNDIINYEDYLRLTKIKSKSFVFPNKTVYLEEYGEEFFLGYLMDYVSGSKFSEMPMSINIKELFKELDLVEKEIRDLTFSESVLLEDLHEDNAFITGDSKIIFIDTDLYRFDFDDTYYNYKSNMRELGNFILPFFLNDYEFKSEKLKEYFNRCITTGKMKPSIVLNETILEMENELKEEIVTFNDLCRSRRLLKK